MQFCAVQHKALTRESVKMVVVHDIADYRMTDALHMDSDLVRSSSEYSDPNDSCLWKLPYDLEMALGVLSL